MHCWKKAKKLRSMLRPGWYIRGFRRSLRKKKEEAFYSWVSYQVIFSNRKNNKQLTKIKKRFTIKLEMEKWAREEGRL